MIKTYHQMQKPPETQKGPEGPSRAKRALRAGGALLSRGASPAVPSALAGLTSGFGTGPGVPPPPRPPARAARSCSMPRKRGPRAGGALLSRGASPAVPSALAGLTSGFGTGPGVPPPPRPPARGPRSWHSPRCPRRAPWGPHGAGGKRLERPLSSGRAPRRASPGPGPVSGARLRRSRALHLRPIDQVFSLGPRVEGAS